MPSVTRLGNRCSGHGCFPPRPCIEASSTVFANGIGTHRQGDGWATHCCGDSCHAGSLSEGSRSVFVNGKAISRTGDPVSCGSAAMEGSPNVFSG